MLVVHIKNETFNINYCKYYKNKNKIFLNGFNITNLNCNKMRNYIINKNNCVGCIFKSNDNICKLNMFIHFKLIYVNFEQILHILKIKKICYMSNKIK